MNFVGKFHSKDEFDNDIRESRNPASGLNPDNAPIRLEIPGGTGVIEAMALLCSQNELTEDIVTNAYRLASKVANEASISTRDEIALSGGANANSLYDRESRLTRRLFRLTEDWSKSNQGRLISHRLSKEQSADELLSLLDIKSSIDQTTFELQSRLLSSDSIFNSSEHSLLTNFVTRKSTNEIEREYDDVSVRSHNYNFKPS